MFDVAFARHGFIPIAGNVKEYNGIKWTETEHDLDRIYSKDGIYYGAEIKNTLAYIPQRELRIKLSMCKHLRLIPLFILRMAPKTYNWDIIRAGGFSLIFEYQLYPFGFGEFAREVRRELRLPVDCPKTIASGTIQRFINNFHIKKAAL